MVVAAGALNREPHPDRTHRLDLVKNILNPILLGDTASLTVDHMVAAEPGGKLLLQGRIRQHIAGNLLNREPVKGHVGIQGPDHPVPPGPHAPGAVPLEPVGVGVAGQVEPVPGHALSVGR